MCPHRQGGWRSSVQLKRQRTPTQCRPSPKAPPLPPFQTEVTHAGNVIAAICLVAANGRSRASGSQGGNRHCWAVSSQLAATPLKSVWVWRSGNESSQAPAPPIPPTYTGLIPRCPRLQRSVLSRASALSTLSFCLPGTVADPSLPPPLVHNPRPLIYDFLPHMQVGGLGRLPMASFDVATNYRAWGGIARETQATMGALPSTRRTIVCSIARTPAHRTQETETDFNHCQDAIFTRLGFEWGLGYASSAQPHCADTPLRSIYSFLTPSAMAAAVVMAISIIDQRVPSHAAPICPDACLIYW
mmetsp:Transcript_90477/g.156757  ORF Transcript_90477/g.156757 Transcript_90477/m.156757 type:complete len:301 (+) Transcript_90477:2460-3362(+)